MVWIETPILHVLHPTLLMGFFTTGLFAVLCLTPCSQEKGGVPETKQPSTENWVSELFGDHKQTRLVDLILPGTHDSGSYDITGSSAPAPGAPAAYAKVGSIAAKWAKTQDQTLEQQLRGGIRYLDLRVALFEERLVLVHGLVSCDLDGALAGVRSFARDNPREPVLLDLQAMPAVVAHVRLHELLQDVLGDHLFTGKGPPSRWTLEKLWSEDRAVICIVGHSGFADRAPEYRSRRHLDSVWTNSRDVVALRKGLDSRLRARDRDGLQCAYLTFTPGTGTIISSGILGNTGLRSMSKPLFKLPGEWIPQWLDEGLRPNVVSVDFYERTDIVEAVMKANQRLLER